MPLFNQASVLSYYRNYSALGPFFTDNSVKATYLMGVSVNEQEWYYPQLSSHQKYLEQFSYQQLKRAEFEKLLAWYAAQPGKREYICDYLSRIHSNSSEGSLEVLSLIKYADGLNMLVDTLNQSRCQVR